MAIHGARSLPSYVVTVVPTAGLHGFSINLSEPPFLTHYSHISVGVSGNYVSMFFGGDFGSLAEQLAPNTYANYDAFSSATVSGSIVGAITTSFDGLVEHCELKPGASFSYACPTTGDAISRVSCTSKNHTLTLKRR